MVDAAAELGCEPDVEVLEVVLADHIVPACRVLAGQAAP